MAKKAPRKRAKRRPRGVLNKSSQEGTIPESNELSKNIIVPIFTIPEDGMYILVYGTSKHKLLIISKENEYQVTDIDNSNII